MTRSHLDKQEGIILGVIPRGTKTNLGPIVSQDGDIRTRICQRCHLQFSYEIGYGKDRKYCSLCSKELKRIHNSQGYLRQRKIRQRVRDEYSIGQRTVLRAIRDAKKFENYGEDALFQSWFSGLFDGEGYFIAQKAKRQNDGRFTFKLGLGIKFRADEIEVLQKIQQHFRCGTITYQKNWDVNINRHDQVVWSVYKQAELFHIFIPHFEKYPLRSRKAEHFEVWKEIIRLAYLKQHKTKEGTEKYNTLVNQLKMVRDFKQITRA